MLRRILFMLPLLLCCHVQTHAAAKEVLLLNSYHPGYAWNVALLEGMMQVFDKADVPLHLRYEYIDAKSDTTDAFLKELRQLYQQKYRHTRFDVVIASDDDAFHLVRRYRDELFPGAAVVFCGVNDFNLHDVHALKDFTGTAEKFDMEGTVRLALRLHPKARHVALVGGVDRVSQSNARQARQLVREKFPDLTLLDFTEMNVDEMQQALHAAPRDTIILYISYFLTPDGTRLSLSESLRLVAEAGLPMYSAWAHHLRDGMVGGQMLRPQEQGYIAARTALRILHGDSPADIPVLMASSTYPMFDGRQLERFHTDRDLLPPDSIILHEEVSVFQRYRVVIILTVLFICYQSGVILWLLGSIRRRKQAEARWQKEQRARREAEIQLFHSQKMETINTFAGGIAHDFNNILSSISCCCEFAMEGLPPESLPRADMRQALEATARGKRLVGSLLECSRQAPQASTEPVDMRELTTGTLNMLRPLLPAHVQLETNLHDVPPVYGNQDQLTQILMNLCVNAGQAMKEQKEHARIRVELEQTEAEGKPYVRLTVCDSGPGIAPEILPRIFDPFFTTKAKGMGTGLGLAVTRGLVRRHGGQLRAMNGPECGACFEVMLPVTLPKEDAPAA